MSLNPRVQYYSIVYVMSMGAALSLKTVRGLVFVKVSCLAFLRLFFLVNKKLTWSFLKLGLYRLGLLYLI